MQQNQKNFRKFNKIPLITSILFLTLFVFVFFFLYQKINKNNTLAKELQLKWKTEEVRREEIRSLERSLKNIEEEKRLLETHFAYSTNVVPFLDIIEKLGEQVKAKVEIISVDILKDKKVLSVNVKTAGTFDSIYRFLTLLENSSYELEFPSVNIQAISAGEVSAKLWEANFKIQLISFRE